MDPKELLNNPGTAAFSRIKYLQRFGYTDQVTEFINGLFLAAVESKYKGDWDDLTYFLEGWENIAVGLQFQGMVMPELGPIPWAEFRKPLEQSTVALVTTGGVSLPGQTPYSERGDASYRTIPRDADTKSFHIWHPGYDNVPANQDINCIFPLDRFKEMEAEGVIGRLAETNYAFMGLIPEPEHLVNETAPEVALRLKDAGVDAVFLAST